MSDVNNFKDQLLYEVQKAFYDERGMGAKYRLTLTGVPYITAQLGKNEYTVDELKDWLLENKFCEDIVTDEDELQFNAKVKNCCLKTIRNTFADKGMQPLSCPIANMFMYAIEKLNGLSPELLPIKMEEEYCGLSFAKMADSSVVDGK